MTQTQTPPLAIDGGPKAFTQPTGKPTRKIGVEEFFSIAERFGFTDEAMGRLRGAVSNDDLLGNGPNLARYITAFPSQTKADAFEALARQTFQVKHALAVSSGTAALHCAMVAAGVKPGTEVIVPAIGFLATAMAATLAGGVPVFCDVDKSLQIDPTKIQPLITERTVAVAPTHHWGSVCDMDPILAIARRCGLRVIEDCAQTPGGSYRGKPVGSIGDIGCFSISAYKIIGGGEGGLAITSDDRLFDRIRQFAEAGGLWRKDRFASPTYEGELFPGTNYRPSELESAINVVQLGKLPDLVKRQREIKRRILSQLSQYREIEPQRCNDPEGEVGYFIRFFPQDHDLARKIVDALRAEGIGGGTRGPKASSDWHLYCDMFPVTLANARNCRRGDCPVAEDLHNRCVTLSLTDWYAPEDCDRIAAGMNKVFSAYCTRDADAAAWL